MTTTTQQIDRLETQLDSFDAGRRREALDTLWALAQRGDIPLPALGDDLNLHSHTFYSYNAYGYCHLFGRATAEHCEGLIMLMQGEHDENGGHIGVKSFSRLDRHDFMGSEKTEALIKILRHGD